VVHISFIFRWIRTKIKWVSEVGWSVNEVAGRGEVVAASVPVAVASFVIVGRGCRALGWWVVGFGSGGGCGFRGRCGTGRLDNSFVWVEVGRFLLRLLGPGCWLLLFLLLLHPTRTQNPQHMLGLGLLLLLVVGRTSALPRRVDFPKTCLPLLWIHSNSGGYWRRPVEWRRGFWDIISGMVLFIVFLTRRGGLG